MPGMDPSRVINGTFGYVYIDGVERGNINHCEAAVEAEKKELKLAGELYTKHKVTGLKGTGTISGFKVDSVMIAGGFSRFELIVKLDDPEAYGFERVRLTGCMVDKVSLAGFTAGEEVTEEVPFTFEGHEMLDAISG